ncbi:hypothetical protein HYFRA_00009868 [Hymenoscyphus fraxineus]|uniref:CENP-V/GFA domain-containing protein n=1 Tax=Hymenoscyphus fraxineus TaxID=746836 RepID=A0A9N9PYC7_9HELO|nr:hypothetical protein HYFRA_00009868 [Hymenoscyphus fraxineus]
MAAELFASEFATTVSSNDSTETHGSCLCGKVRYTITGQPKTRVVCHCLSCKKATGSSFMANEFYDREQVKIQDPDLVLKTYTDTSPESGSVLARSFCGNCGSNMVAQNSKRPEAMAVASGTLDDETLLREWTPRLEFYCKRRSDWLSGPGLEEERKFQGMI